MKNYKLIKVLNNILLEQLKFQCKVWIVVKTIGTWTKVEEKRLDITDQSFH